MAYNGLAEVELQGAPYEDARRAAQKAHELSPDEWVAAYNLGMIEERLRQDDAGLSHLSNALALDIPDSRHRLLVHLYLWRIHQRRGDQKLASGALAALKREKAGLEEWQVIMSADEAQALRAVLSDDIDEARRLIMDGTQHVPVVWRTDMSVRRLIGWVAVLVSVALADGFHRICLGVLNRMAMA